MMNFYHFNIYVWILIILLTFIQFNAFFNYETNFVFEYLSKPSDDKDCTQDRIDLRR